jgi:uncharacterized phage protein (TIGR01671 family)
MMREILLRGKRLDNGEWVEGGYFFHYGECRIVAEGTVNDYIIHYPVDPATVGQYTGLMANGKRIFEGDMVAQNWYDYDEPSDDSFGEVVFCEYDCSFSVMDKEKDGIVPLGRCHAYHWEAEVIANIHDNSELLEVTPDE